MISIITPAYNAEKYIAETINSVLNQIYTDWELIIVDDGSKDNTAEIVKQFCEKDNRISYYSKENSGVSDTRNLGMSLAKGKYIALLDADDMWNNDKLSIVNSVFNKEDIDWVYSDVIDIFESGKKKEKELNKTGNILDSILLWDGRALTAPSGIVFRRQCYTNGLKFDRQFSTAADQDLVIQLASKYKGYHINKPLWRYRILGNSMSHDIAVMEKDHIGVYKKAAINKLFKSFWFKQQCFSNLYWILAGSWWKDGNNKKRGLYFIVRALIANPFSIVKIFNKSIK